MRDCIVKEFPRGGAEAQRNPARSANLKLFAQIPLWLCGSVCRFFLVAACLMMPIGKMALAQTVAGDTFADGKDGAKVHTASGFVCPAKIGLFERDAVGESDPDAHADFCAYSALDGVYGTIKLSPVQGTYDPKLTLARDFAEQEATGGKKISEGNASLASGGHTAPLNIYTRNYETSKLEDLHYRVLFGGVAVNSWSVETVIEYAEPRDATLEQEFLKAVYAAAESEIGRP